MDMEIKHENRLLFLKIFTQELVVNTNPGIQITEKEVEANIPSITEQENQATMPQTPLQINIQRPIRPPPRRIRPRMPQPAFPVPSPIQPDLQGIVPEGFSLGKINSLLEDPTINMIECPGPGKLILVRSLGNIKATKISLNEEEVKEIIENFSQQTRIPIITGIFKAAVGNLLITAIISEFVGSRFIITKKLG